MTTKPDGGAAFPCPDPRAHSAPPGMSYRKWLIGKALSGMTVKAVSGAIGPSTVAELVIATADAVLAALAAEDAAVTPECPFCRQQFVTEAGLGRHVARAHGSS